MSDGWQAYVDNNLMCPLDEAGTTLSSAALAGLEDCSVWAQSPSFPGFSPEEIEAVKGIMDGKNPGSFTVGGVKYMVIMSEDPSTKLRGKCKGGGCSICKTNQALIVGIWQEPVTASICNKIVEALYEYMISVDY
ncbi:profilin-3 [Dunaliella salina]|uniref:Profilin n=1 Tax=Dunaliella salina TaxID=3046 RepID=A0ABQ7G2W5_DUNSA|nr:profilin-3 [Dunaliella salina]|eukprot:KAF5828948.1 profilin-3 [Dunaliella salina]